MNKWLNVSKASRTSIDENASGDVDQQFLFLIRRKTGGNTWHVATLAPIV